MIAHLLALPLLALPSTPGIASAPTQRAGSAPGSETARPAPLPAAAQDPGRAAPAGPAGQEIPPIQVLEHSYVLHFSEDAAQGLTLLQFVKICQQYTGINFYTTEETARLLDQQKVRMFGTKEIQKTDFYSFFQIIMIVNKFVCTKIGPEHLAVVVVQSLETTARGTARQDAQYVLPEDLEKFADQPATLIQTVVDLPNTDVRTLSNSMRGMVVDPNTLQIIPVGNSSSLIIQGFGSNVAALVRMLHLVDEASKPVPPILPEFTLIPLEYAAADEISATIEDLLEASRRAVSSTRAPQQQGATAAIPQQEAQTRILTDPRTNSLLVMAMPEEMPRIKQLVAQLDVDTIERERTYHFYSLENVDASAMAEVLTSFIQDASRVQTTPAAGQAQPGRAQGGTRSTSGEIAIVADPATNSLLIAAGRSRYEEVFDLVKRMDRRQDQVLIETALVELSGRDFLDLGVELGGANIPEAAATGGFGVTSFGLSDFVDNDGDGIPDTRVPRGTTGITAGILNGEDFNLPALIVAISERRNTNVLNIPSVLVNNNGSATVKTLDQQPTTTVTGIASPGVAPTESFGQYVDAGITLQISPTISASRYLRLNITLEVSNFLGTVQGSIPPPKITRTIETAVSVPDGDTMVIGGIIVDNRTDTATKVPLLGDIPVIGHLFRRDSNSKDRTSLYFFVTPHIMHDREFADLSSYSYKKKLEAADTIGADRIRMIDGKFGRDAGALDFEGFNVPLYQPPPRGPVSEEEIGLDSQRVDELLREGGVDPASVPPADDAPSPDGDQPQEED